MNVAVSDTGVSIGARTRRCLASGDVLPEALLMRFAADPQAEVVPDVAAKLPGRGLWVRADTLSIAVAVEKNLFSRAAKTALRAPADLGKRAEERLVAQILGALGLARRAGALLLGFDAIERALRSGDAPAVIVQADEASPDGARKLQAAALSQGLAPYVLGALTGEELSLALGKANVIHAALKPGRIAERVIFDSGRLAGFRPQKTWIWTGFKGLAHAGR
jgi:predicted RNA-binding protein YlxR (DUF448 family)